VVMKISIESSSVLPNSLSQVDITTQKRTITTNVLIDDGGVVVLGGLISHSDTRSDSKIPVLGSIPLLGNLFKTRSGHATKNNLMIFIRPKILRDGNAAAYLTDSKYNYMLDQQKRYNKGEMDVPILPKHEKPLMPPAPPVPPASPAKLAPTTPEAKAKAAKEQEEYDAEAVRRLQQRQKGQPNSDAPPVTPLPQPPAGTQGATTHPDGEPPYATEPPGVLMPQATPPPPPPEAPKQ